MSVYSGRRGRDKLDLEILSRSDKGITQVEYDDIISRLDALESDNRVIMATQGTVNSIDNLLVNSDFSRSVLSFTGAGSATDVYAWVRGITPANTISTTSNPLWDDTNGDVDSNLIGAANDIGQNFPTRVIQPGITYYLNLLAKKSDSGDTATTKLYAGVWDSGAANNWLTGTAQTPTLATSPALGAATTHKYKVVTITDTGNVIVSNEATIATSFAVLDSGHYNIISWLPTSGVLSYRVYRTTGPIALIAELPAGNTSFNDIGASITSPATLPTANPPSAYVEVSNFGTTVNASWQAFRAVIKVPGNYDLSATSAGNQWFRLQLSTVAPSTHIQFTRIGLSSIPGGWALSSKDTTAVGDITIDPTGDGGKGNGGIGGEIGFIG